MNQRQRQWVEEIWQQARDQLNAECCQIYSSFSIVRIQSTRDNENYRMFTVAPHDDKGKIRLLMTNSIKQIMEESKYDYFEKTFQTGSDKKSS